MSHHSKNWGQTPQKYARRADITEAPRDTPGRRLPARVGELIAAVLILLLAMVPAGSAFAGESAAPSRFRDADGWLDISNFLDTAYGFVPVLVPITEPAIGYGATVAAIFIDRDVKSGQGGGHTRPNISVLGGFGTENGTRGLFATHLGTWRQDSIRTIAALADMDVNLDYFGLGGGRSLGDTGIGYSVAARGGLLGGNFRLGATSLWAGLRYTRVRTDVALNAANPGLPGILPGDTGNSEIAALTPSLTLDTRDNFFTPTRGWYVDISALVARDSLGGDRDFDKATLTVIYHQPVSRVLFLGVRGGARGSTDDTPFYLRPYVSLRGVQSMRYQGERAAEIETELRWQMHPRFSLVGFAGAGVARGAGAIRDREQSVVAGGAGFRYLMARKHGLHMGLDVAAGPDKPVFYVVFGNSWMRP